MSLTTFGLCAYCGSDFTYSKSGPGRLRKWCSESCRLKACRDRCPDRRTPCLDCGESSWGERCHSCSSAARCVGPVVAQCKICDADFESQNGKRYCSEDCRAEFYARQMRDQYRAKRGLPVDPNRPTKSFGRRRPWRDEDRHPKTPASAAG